jgi:TRAP-type mannitol/chloroaromatic compound transport system permease small subunit
LKGEPPARLRSLIRALDAFAEWSGWLVAWLIVPLIGAMVYEVVARYFFRAPTVWAQDLSYMLYGALFMLGGAYTLRWGGHIRTDFLYDRFGVRGQALLDSIAYLFFFFPAFGVFLWFGWGYFVESWRLDERAISPWSPPIYPFRAVLPLAAALLLVQGVSETLKSLYALAKGERP